MLVPLFSFSWQMATAALWVFGVPEIQRPKTSQLTRILLFRLTEIATFLVMESPVTHKWTEFEFMSLGGKTATSTLRAYWLVTGHTNLHPETYFSSSSVQKTERKTRTREGDWFEIREVVPIRTIMRLLTNLSNEDAKWTPVWCCKIINPLAVSNGFPFNGQFILHQEKKKSTNKLQRWIGLCD